MKKIKLIRFVESLILLPITTMSIVPVGPSVGYLAQSTINIVSSPQTVLSQKLNKTDDILASNNSEDSKVAIQKARAEAVDAYFKARNMPLEGMGMKMVLEAEKNGLDWRLLPAIAVRESTGGKYACKKVKYSSFGWGSCKINFKSDEHGIEIVAKNLGGNNPKTAKHYANKNTKQILRAYNPPSVVPRYAEQVMSIMNNIGEADIASEITTVTIPTAAT